ncbi:hypothetical protein GPJ56_006803 [Histomonas meleagridis]|uniref:uncharacterized protein n=1 Tax=Histomonas meleagridis TaxID=135588 RepID=UPI00355ABEEA|nr:hypothetical protein GPJ56_006803 [Histomonas meleagridis]KAH0800212.1 hypothetical protein GO595_007324 [Histomonas meleagridis]
MISREEHAILQKQYVQMHEEKQEMQAQIQGYEQSNLQIDILKQQITEMQALKAREDKQFQEEIILLKTKILKYERRIKQENDSSQPKTWDEKRLIKMEKNLKELTDLSTQYNNSIHKLDEILVKVRNESKQIDESIKGKQALLSKASQIYKKIGSFGSITMKTNELENQKSMIEKQTQKIAQRITNRKKSILEITNSIETKEKQFEDLEHQINVLHSKSDKLSSEKQNLEKDVESLLDSYKSISSKLSESEQRLQEENKTTDIQLHSKEEDLTKIKSQVSSVSKQTEEILQGVSQMKIEIDVIANKKNALIDQLKKSIQEKIADISRSRSTSPYVQRLISSQEQHWIERQKLIEEYESVYKQHKKIAEEVERKSEVIEQAKFLAKMVKRSESNDQMENMKKLFSLAQNENNGLARSIFVLEDELNMLKQGN